MSIKVSHPPLDKGDISLKLKLGQLGWISFEAESSAEWCEVENG